MIDASSCGDPPTGYPTRHHLGGLLSSGWNKNSENMEADNR